MRALEIALYALCWASTFLIAGVHPPVQVSLAAAALVLVLGTAFALRSGKGLRLVPLAWPMLCALAWTALQGVPLPAGLLRVLSPQAAALRAELGVGAAPITLDAAATALELAKQLAYLGVFLTATALLRTPEASRRAATALAVLGGAVALSLTLHRALDWTRFFGLYAPKGHPGSGYFAPFVNGNHAASLLALCALCAFGLAAASERARRLAWSAVGAACAAAVLATGSRGAALALAVGGFVLGSALAGQRFGRARGLLLATVIVATLGAGGLMLASGLRTRMLRHPGEVSWISNQKTRAWDVALRLSTRYPLTGVGRGAFEAPAAALRAETEQIRLNYAENFVLQVLSEWGWPIALVLLGGAGWILLAAVQRLPTDPILAGLLGGALSLTLHGLLDCGFEIPGVLLPLTLALGALMARAEGEQRSRRRARLRARPVDLVGGAAIAVAMLVLAGLATRRTLDHDLAAMTAAPPPAELDAILARHPASAELEMLAGQIALARRDPSALRHLGRAMRLQPSLPRPHELAAIELMRLAKPGQAAIEYRLASERGARVADEDLIRWLGKNALDAVPRTVPAYERLAATLAAARRWEDAEQAFTRAAELGDARHVRRARLTAFDQAPPEQKRAAVELLVRDASDGDDLAVALAALVSLAQLDRADEVAAAGMTRFPTSARLVVEAARARAARGDLEGARGLISRTSRFDARGRLLLAELAVELAEKAHDVEAATAAQARLRLLRAKVDLEQPTVRTPR
jgi:hypothetical protein